MSDLPDYLKMPSKQALEVFQKSYENHTGPFDSRLIPNQWLMNERALSAELGDRIEELERELAARTENYNYWRQYAEHLKYRWDDIPWEEIEGLFYPDTREVHAWSREAADVFRKILALREQEEGNE